MNFRINGPYGRFGYEVSLMKSIVTYVIGDEYEGYPSKMLLEDDIRTISENASIHTGKIWETVPLTRLIKNACEEMPFVSFNSFSKDDKAKMEEDLCERLADRLERYSRGRTLSFKKTRSRDGSCMLCLRWE